MSNDYYQQNAQTFFDGTVNVDMSSLYESFTRHLSPGASVLDAGCGSGRDSKAFCEKGYQVEAFDASSEMVALAQRHTGLLVQQMTFADVAARQKYDGIWCCASLLHAPAVDLPDVMQKIAHALKPGGVWYVSFKYGDGEREKDGRRFTDMNEASFKALLQCVPEIKIMQLWTTEDKRPGREEIWLNAMLSKS